MIQPSWTSKEGVVWEGRVPFPPAHPTDGACSDDCFLLTGGGDSCAMGWEDESNQDVCAPGPDCPLRKHKRRRARPEGR